MRSKHSYRTLSVRVWNCFLVLALGAIGVGALYGAGAVSGVVVLVAIGVVVIAFVPWAVLQLDPRGLEELGVYAAGADDSSK